MAWEHTLDEQVNLFVEDRISQVDATRQIKSVREILNRYKSTPGQILADEVGMGKTFVALAVGASISLNDERPVVIMVPTAVLEKWQRDFSVFRENCLSNKIRSKLTSGVAKNGVEFLKYLDDPPERRKKIIFLAHGALSRSLSDGWVKLAIIQRAMKFRKNAENEYRSVARFAGKLLMMQGYSDKYPNIWELLLNNHTSKWKTLLYKNLNKEDFELVGNDDPVPAHIVDALEDVSLKALLDRLWEEIQNIPKRESSQLESRLKIFRKSINTLMPKIWKICFLKSKIQLPLLILDEAHHLKNDGTRLASMFSSQEALNDADTISKGGQLASVFERMLFLTATPFQLGHHELCNILNRFNGISWDSKIAPVGGKDLYSDKLTKLRHALDESQNKAKILEREWGKLGIEDLITNNKKYFLNTVDDWWDDIQENSNNKANSRIIHIVEESRATLVVANDLLKEFVLRHTRTKHLSAQYSNVPRRRKLSGRAIAEHDDSHNDVESEGVSIEGDMALPFLLAARLVAITPNKRPVSAEGLASSYETFLETRKNLLDDNYGIEKNNANLDEPEILDSHSAWYIDNIKKSIKPEDRVLSELHPKISPVVERVVKLWEKGEKVLIFCHYIKTGRALRAHISHLLRKKLYQQASKKLSCSEKEVESRLHNMGQRFRKGSGLRIRAEELIHYQLKSFEVLSDYKDNLIDIINQFMISPTFLVRYFEFAGSQVQADTLHKAFEYKEVGGLSFNELLFDFFKFMSKLTSKEICSYIDALDSIQTGNITQKSDFEDEQEKDSVLAAVRLINGSTPQLSRQHLMLAFNTPFYPEILVASSVLAEGVDLHLNCRHIIHYDLSWNPSDLEQRTGRIDRIGAKAEKVGQPIHIYYPYLAGTQDEKMYRVVMDRDRWFNVVMGGSFKIDYETTERISDRIPLPSQVLEKLKLDLSVA